METVKKVSVLSFAKFHTLLGAVIGLICGILYSFGGLFIDALVSIEMLSAARMSTPGLSYGTVLAFGALLGMPAIFAAFGFAIGLAGGVLYNTYAKWFGGLRVEFE